MPQSPEQSAEKVIEIPGVGNIAFPAHMTPDDINKAAAKLYQDANPKHPPAAKEHSWLDTATEWLPTVGGAAGGLIGAAGGTVGGMGVGGVPGAVGGAAVGGMAGEAARQLANRWLGKPAPATMTEAATDIASEGAIQGASELAGAGLVKGAAKVGPKLMQSALKPAYASVAASVKKAEMPRVVQTLLDEGINVTPGGIGKINTLLNSTNAEIKSIIANSTDVVYPENVIKAADPLLARVSSQVAPMSDRAAAAGVVDEFAAVHGGAPNYPMKPISVQRAQELKQGTYGAIGDRGFGETKGAALEAEKQLARGLKEGIEAAHPAVKAPNAREGALLDAKEAIARRVAVAGNRDMAGLAWITANPATFIAFLLDRSPAVKSMLARGMYQSASKATGVPQNLIRLGMQALATGGEMQPMASHAQEPQ